MTNTLRISSKRSRINAITLLYIGVSCVCLQLNGHTADGFTVTPKRLVDIGRLRYAAGKATGGGKDGATMEERAADGRSGCEAVSGDGESVGTASSSSALRMSSGGGGGGGEATDGNSSSRKQTNPASRTTATLRELLAEFIGTFLIVQIGCGTVCAAVFKSAQAGLWQIAAVWSIAVTIAIATTAAVSGAHLNPAVTFSLALLRSFRWTKVLPFVLAQLSGAVVAAATNLALYRDSILSFEAANSIVRGTQDSLQSAKAFGEYWSVNHWSTAFLAEAYGTAILAFVIFALTHPKNDTTAKHPHLIPPLIGSTVGALISVIAPLTQAGFNPARDFGPRIVALLAGWGSVAMQGAWLYILAPLLGAPLGAFLADKVLYATDENDD